MLGRHLSLPATSVPVEEAGAHFGFLAPFIVLDAPASSALTQKLLGWRPEEPGLIADLEEGHYFTS